MGKSLRVGFYLRVSTGEQTTDNQRADLERVAAQRGWNVVETYIDHGISGAKGRNQRPAFDRMCTDAAHGKLDLIAAWSIDRLGRSIQHVSAFMAEVLEQQVALYLHQQNVDGTTASGRAMLGMATVFAEFERDVMRERIHAGIARARISGTKSGNPIGRPRVPVTLERQIRELRARGAGKLRIAKQLRCGVGTVSRVLSAAA
jgi:DNA invertase Pin-like site-specific DNA recombinase